MTPNQYKNMIEKEIQKVNERIDYKIVHGMRYSDESRKHKLLLQKISRYRTENIFSRLLKTLSPQL